jgi:hypothetical protein
VPFLALKVRHIEEQLSLEVLIPDINLSACGKQNSGIILRAG